MSNRRSPLRLVLGLGLLGVTGLANGGCAPGALPADGAAQVGAAVLPQAVPPVTAPQQPAAGEPAAQEPGTKAPERALDAEAVRALAEEVARLRAQLADMDEELRAARAGDDGRAAAGEPVAPIEELDGAEATAGADGEPRVGADEGPLVREGGDDGPVREVVVERQVGDDEDVVVVEEEPTVIYEQVVYETETVYQWVPFGHVHHLGCGHHYYGCSCHPWYYDCHSSISFHLSDHDWRVWVGCGNPYTYYHVGYWHGGYDYDHDAHYRHDYYVRHVADGASRRDRKRAFRKGYVDGFQDGREVAAPPPASSPSPTGPVVAGRRERSGSAAGGSATAPVVRSRGGEEPGAGRSPLDAAPSTGSTPTRRERGGGESPVARTEPRTETPRFGSGLDDAARERARRAAADQEGAAREAPRVASPPEIVRTVRRGGDDTPRDRGLPGLRNGTERGSDDSGRVVRRRDVETPPARPRAPEVDRGGTRRDIDPTPRREPERPRPERVERRPEPPTRTVPERSEPVRRAPDVVRHPNPQPERQRPAPQPRQPRRDDGPRRQRDRDRDLQ